MELKDKLTNLEISIELKKLGFKQKSEHYWIKDFLDESEFDGWHLFRISEYVKIVGRGFVLVKEHIHNFEYYSAFDVTELGEMLPDEVNKGWRFREPRLNIVKYDNLWIVIYIGEDGHCSACCEEVELCSTKSEIEADARAMMLIYLLKNKLIEV